MESMTPQEREVFIAEHVQDILKIFDEYKGKDISRLSITNRDKYIEGRVASDLAIMDDLLIQLHSLISIYEKALHRTRNTAALLFIINNIDKEHIEIDVVAKVEKVAIGNDTP